MTETKTEETKKFEPPLVVDEGSECRDGHDYSQSGGPEVRVCRDCSAKVGKPHGRGCRTYIQARWEHVVPHTDLRSITRNPELFETVIDITDEYDRFRHTWITCGQTALRIPDNSRRHEYALTCYLGKGATDFEHDSAYAFQIPLIGWQFESAHYGRLTFVAWIPSHVDQGDFRVPSAGYNPFELEDTGPCDSEHCGHDHHPIVPEGHYIAPDNRGLFKAVAGRKVRVTFGPPRDSEVLIENLSNVLATTKGHSEDLMELAGRAAMKIHEDHEGDIARCDNPFCTEATKLCGFTPDDEDEEVDPED